jgi:2Fe-2S ferredoxin
MIKVHYIEHDGTEHVAELSPGTTLMQGAIENSIPGILGDCGGGCSCATCHVYVDAAWMDKAGAPDALESSMLECAIDPNEQSRLSCQIEARDELDGIIVRMPAAQY